MAGMIREEKDGMVWLDCSMCGKMFPAYDADNGDMTEMLDEMYRADDLRHCDACKRIIEEEAKRKKAEESRRAFVANLPKLAEEAGIPDLYRINRETGKALTAPIVPHLARWIWEHRGCNLLISGKTGVGKSTSACFIGVRMLEEGRKIRYVKLRRLLSEWRAARTSDEAFSDEKFFADIQKLHLLILDEVADKTKTTESGQEMMYELLDMIADGEMRTRLWMLGNFRDGVLEELFGDREPVFRRVEENFVCAGATENTVKIFHVYNNKNGE